MLDLLPSQRSLRVFIAAVQQYSGISIADIRRRRRGEGKLVKGKLIVSKTKRNLDQNFRKFRSKTQWIGSVQQEKVSKKLVHLLRWTTFPGRTGRNRFWLNGSRTKRPTGLASFLFLFLLCFLCYALDSSKF